MKLVLVVWLHFLVSRVVNSWNGCITFVKMILIGRRDFFVTVAIKNIRFLKNQLERGRGGGIDAILKGEMR